MSITRPQVLGGTIAASDSASISSDLNANGLPIGTLIWNEDVGDVFRLTSSSASLVPDQILAVRDTVGARWIKVVVTAANAETADAPTNATTFTAALNVATPTLKGLIASTDKAGLPRVGSNLTDASVTIQPRTLKCSKFILPPATLTANRSLTIGNTSGQLGDFVQIVLRDLTANTYSIKDQAGVDMLVWTGSTAGQAMIAQFYLSGTGWILSTAMWTE